MTNKLTNDELVERLRNYTTCTESDIDEAANRIEQMNKFLRHNVFAEKHFGVFFICGEAGEKDVNGIPEQIHICPAYGSDVVYRFTRGDSSAPEW
jgi:hypothetical protein